MMNKNVGNRTQVVLLACGPFNPITNMHLRMFELARDHLESTGRYQVEKGIISPVGDGYKKKDLTAAWHRVEMARLATESSTWITVDDWESQQSEWVETAKVLWHHHDKLLGENNQEEQDTVMSEKTTLEGSEVEWESVSLGHSTDVPKLNLLCGADLLESFGVPNLWSPEDIAEIVGSYGVVVISRCSSDAEKFITQSELLHQHRENIHIVREWVTNDISSTLVRQTLCRRQSVRYLLPDSVVDYIQDRHLYSKKQEEKKAHNTLTAQRYSTEIVYITQDLFSVTEEDESQPD
ncbi:nicotinamide/nicotinic acid mononucleotide adenylyltransferase 1-like [Hoplias malabaricus]|uniref:nicotinamide/nicotinic acid mononucleotide adenylyltransferase 1-like n=1 Tax=Hoplias malabaricus TaxID=27720 RepID=UPI003462421A